MAVVAVNEVGDGRDGGDDNQGLVTLTRSFEVFTNSTLDDQVVVLASPLLPALYTQYATSTASVPGAKCVRRRARQHSESPWKWSVTCDYSTRWLEVGRADPNPLNRPPEIAYSSIKVSKTWETDLDGVQVANVNRETFEPPPTRVISRLLVTVERNEIAYDAVAMNEFQNSVNDSTFLGFDAGRVRCNEINARVQYEGEYTFFRVRYVFEFLNTAEPDNAFQLVLLNSGYTKRTGGTLVGGIVVGGTITEILETSSAQKPSKPKLLNALGELLDVTTEDPVFITFRICSSRNFGALNIAA